MNEDKCINRDEKPQKTLFQVCRETLRRKHYSYATEKHYISWIQRYVRFHNKKHPRDVGPSGVEDFLTYLAVKGDVAPSTQNQALKVNLILL